VLKPLREAMVDGDFIHAVIKGSAINNDGHSWRARRRSPRPYAGISHGPYPIT